MIITAAGSNVPPRTGRTRVLLAPTSLTAAGIQDFCEQVSRTSKFYPVVILDAPYALVKRLQARLDPQAPVTVVVDPDLNPRDYLLLTGTKNKLAKTGRRPFEPWIRSAWYHFYMTRAPAVVARVHRCVDGAKWYYQGYLSPKNVSHDSEECYI